MDNQENSPIGVAYLGEVDISYMWDLIHSMNHPDEEDKEPIHDDMDEEPIRDFTYLKCPMTNWGIQCECEMVWRIP